MTTNRTPLGRPQKSRITPEVVELFKRHEVLAPIRDACLEGRSCKSANSGRHCPDCEEHRAVSNQFRDLMGVMPWEFSPLDTTEADPPNYLDPQKAAQWREAFSLRRELLEER